MSDSGDVLDVSALVAARGYVKSAITRMNSFILSEDFATASCAKLKTKRERLKGIFQEYERYNKEILNLKPEDDENVGKYEDIFTEVLARLDDAISDRSSVRLAEKPVDATPVALTRLPHIEIVTFTGKYCEYAQFKNLFNSVIHNNPKLDNIQRLYYLRSFLKGEPLDLIKNLPLCSESYADSIKILADRYANNTLIMNDHITQLIDLPSIKNSALGIRDFISQIKQHIAALKNLDPNVSGWDPILLCILLRKVDPYTAKSFQMDRDIRKSPSLLDLLNFLEKRAMALETVDGTGQHQASSSYKSSGPRASVNVAASAPSARPCPFCKYTGYDSHRLFACPKFKLAPVKQRIQFVSENKICKICLNPHLGRCKYHFRCNTCKKAHSTLLHEECSPAVKSCVEATVPAALVANNNAENNRDLLPTAKVKLIRSDGTEMIIKAMLDSCSQLSFVTSHVVQELGLKPKESTTDILGITNAKNKSKYSIPLEVHSLKSDYKIMINCKVVEQITCQQPQQSFPPFTLPPGIDLADDTYNDPSDIQMLISSAVTLQMLLPDQQQLGEGGAASTAAPIFVRTKLGHVVGGDLSVSSRTLSQQVTLLCTSCDSSISNTMKRFWETEEVPQIFNENATESKLCEDIFKKSVQLKDQHFQVDLPLKVPLEQVNEHLGDSFHLALNRFLNLEKKLHKDESLFQEYKKFIDEIIESGHGHYVDIGQYDLKNDPLCFIAHHAVINEKSKTTRLRSVLDAAMKTSKKISINDLLLNGDVVQRDLFDILLLFRLGEHIFTTDIKKMFRCIKLNPAHASLQNILWRENPSTEIRCIQLTTVQFGFRSSSFLATRCLDELASIYKEELPVASFILKNCTFVDDVLYAGTGVDKMIEAKNQLVELLKRGGFKTHKWASNTAEILQDIPKNEQHFDNIDFEKQNFNLRALGIDYNIKNDCFTISCPEKFGDRQITKREILSYISKFYDPLGFIAPIIVTAKSFIQTLWAAKIGWDSPLTGGLRDKWVTFSKSLDSMVPNTLQRMIPIENAHTIELVGFADASSSTALGCCIYLRLIQEGEACLYLLCSKSRLNPLNKPLTVPRLELNAALLLAKLMVKVHKAISIKMSVNNVRLFTDSKIVLAWIGTQVTQLNAYVANRVQLVAKLTAGWSWHYVPTSDNPADLITRGVNPQELADNTLWWSGPPFLQNDKYTYDSKPDLPTILPEIKTSQVNTLSSSIALPVVQAADDLFTRYSDIHKMSRIFAYIWRFYKNCKTKNNDQRIKSTFLTAAEINSSLLNIIKHEQGVHFKDEIRSLNSNNENVKGSLKSLHPFIDGQGLLRVGGRIENSNVSFSQKHPIILPKQSRITDLIIHHEHLRLLHAPPRLLLSSLNQRYWIVNGYRHIKKILYKCILCFRMKGECAKQLMGSFPSDRIISCRSFQKVGIDMAGPIMIKNSRVRRALQTKGFVLVIVCFVSRSIHLECASDMTTDCFLACFKRFIARRGLPTDVFCDNGSNFRGAKNELVRLYELQSSRDHQTQVLNYAAQQGINFHFTPSYSPVFAGLAEAAVKSMKFHLKRIIQNYLLTYEQLNTVLCTIEAVLNSRPLLPVSADDVNDFAYITPGHFLIGTALTSFPERDVVDIPTNRLKFWEVCNKVRGDFWKTWHRYYLNVLQCRPKWRDSVPNVRIGALVILREPNCPPLTWHMARIVNVYPGKDNKVRVVDVVTPNGKVYKRSLNSIAVLPVE